jgi:two-component system OmpR family sensor kinase
MSSSPPTDVTTISPAKRPGRFNPASWPLRTRLVAIIIALLAVLGLIVGATAQIFLHKLLYSQLDTKLYTAVSPGNQGHFGGGGNHGGPYPDLAGTPFPGSQDGTIIINLTTHEGGVVDTFVDSDSRPAIKFITLPNAALTKLAAIPVTGLPEDVDLGSVGEYRVVSMTINNGDGESNVRVTGLPLSDTQSLLRDVELVTAGAVILALLVAGWAGAAIVRRTLKPLSRMAATATKVSELRLDRGEVELAQRVPVGDTDMRTEVGQVGAALNRMLDHVGSALEARHASEQQVRQFVADASHELRTPLAAIRGYAELSRRSRRPVPEEISHVLRRVESEAIRMTALVEDLLLLARLDAGRPLANDPVDLTMLVVDAVSDAHAAGPGHYWQLDLPQEPVTVIGDQQRLHQVLANLLANARTHTPEGTTVTVAVSSTPDLAVIRVIDGGPGIPRELQPHIFERFARGDSSRSRAAGSTGLGLSIVHAVVTAHGGSVSVQSQPGHTQFTVLLPMVLPVAGRPPMSPQDYARITR